MFSRYAKSMFDSYKYLGRLKRCNGWLLNYASDVKRKMGDLTLFLITFSTMNTNYEMVQNVINLI